MVDVNTRYMNVNPRCSDAPSHHLTWHPGHDLGWKLHQSVGTYPTAEMIIQGILKVRIITTYLCYVIGRVIGCHGAGTGRYRWRIQKLSCMARVIGFEDVVEYVVTKYTSMASTSTCSFSL